MGAPNAETRTTWRGVAVCSRLAAQLTEVVTVLSREGHQDTARRMSPSQGSWSTSVGASTGTHAGCGAVDLRESTLTEADFPVVVAALRRVGVAAWERAAIPGVWPRHIHGVSCGCAALSRAALAQVDDYLAGRNGLAGHGRDTGPRDWVGVTWETYQAAARPAEVAAAGQTQEDDMAGRLVQVGGEAAIWYACPETGAWWQVPDIEWLGNALPGTVESVNARQRDLIRDSCARTAVAVNPATSAVVATIDPAAIAAAIPADLARQVADELARRLAA